MKKVKLFIAMSLDGYIADSSGNIDWLRGHGNENENIDSYSEFVKEIDTVIMGWNTYHQIVTELSPIEWVYSDFMSYVITSKEHLSSEKIHFLNTKPSELVQRLKEKDGKDIWICGGAKLIQELVDEDLIDSYYITVIPTILGSGIRLFNNTKHEIKLKLIKTKSYNGMTDLVYERR
ncbi:dihydrofolate reductase family protein [Streptococcus dentapri]|uniref:Dihydrofolate reductase family protein n=1 Tax=Streptococcus dentapri TaxID=573564 RepID=A0ABV8CYR1_9STRE